MQAYGQPGQPSYGQPGQPAYGQPDQPVYGQPVLGYPGVPLQYGGGPTPLVPTPPGAPPGGVWIEDNYIGPLTCCIAFFFLPCICCCPIDHRAVYMAPNGLKYHPDGAVVTDSFF